MRPRSRCWAPAAILMSVLLPAPFSPGEHVHLAGGKVQPRVV